MPLATQTKILRVLQNGTFERVGGNQTVKVDVRIIAATNKPLEQAVAQKQFREDLFYRLNVVRIPLPALRERRDDIRLLADYFLRKLAGPGAKPRSLAASTLAALESYHWPGNVRELENCLRRATVVAKGPAILLSDLPAEIIQATGGIGAPPSIVPKLASAEPSAAASSPGPALVPPEGDAQTLRAGSPNWSELARTLFRYARLDPKLKVLPAVEREMIIEALKETQGNQVQAARLLGITRATLRKRVEKFGIKQELNVG
jgi:two-component system nitrogen regulation response regulator GlnG